MRLIATADYVFIEPVAASATTEGGIELPYARPEHGLVLSVGPDAKVAKEGDRVPIMVRWPRFNFDGKDYIVLHDTDIFGKLVE